MNEEIKRLLAQAETDFHTRTDRDVLEFIKGAVVLLLRAELERSPSSKSFVENGL
jgi:hypothetical protein